MTVMNLVLGIMLLVLFLWIFAKNMKRSGILHTLFRIETLLGIGAGLYLTITAVIALIA
jgi:hypothetical protein